MVCILCGQSITSGRSAPTTDGHRVHIRCADQEASQAFVRRQRHVLGHAIVLGLLMCGWSMEGDHWLLVAVMIAALLHLVLHHAWWRQVAPCLWREVRGLRTDD